MTIKTTPIPSGVTQYTDALAVAAIEAEDPLTVAGRLISEGSTFGGIRLIDSTGATDQTVLDFVVQGEQFTLRHLTDDLMNITNILTMSMAAGSPITFVAIPVLPASNPTSDNQAVRKAYVDPGLAKAYGTVAGDGTLQANSFNIASVVKDSTGNYTVTWDTDFANANYVCIVTAEVDLSPTSDQVVSITVHTPAVGSIKVEIMQSFNDDSGGNVDLPFHIVAFGSQ